MFILNTFSMFTFPADTLFDHICSDIKSIINKYLDKRYLFAVGMRSLYYPGYRIISSDECSTQLFINSFADFYRNRIEFPTIMMDHFFSYGTLYNDNGVLNIDDNDIFFVYSGKIKKNILTIPNKHKFLHDNIEKIKSAYDYRKNNPVPALFVYDDYKFC